MKSVFKNARAQKATQTTKKLLDRLNTENLEARATAEWSKHAGEAVRVEEIGGVLYAFGSELAMLRLEHKMRTGRAAYSENLQTWTYCTDRR